MTDLDRDQLESGKPAGGQDRRTFLKRSSVAVSAAALAGCVPEVGTGGAEATTSERLDERGGASARGARFPGVGRRV
jgi:hypothetical protein